MFFHPVLILFDVQSDFSDSYQKYSEYESGINLQMLKIPAPESKHQLK